MRKIICLSLILMLFLITPVMAQDKISVNVTTINREVYAGIPALFELEITNNQPVTDTFVITSNALTKAPFSDVVSSIFSEPNRITIVNGQTEKVRVKVITLANAEPKRKYRTQVFVKSLDHPEIEEEVYLFLSIIPSNDIIRITPLTESIAPGNNVPIEVSFNNRISYDMNNFEVHLVSDVFEDVRTLSLTPNQTLIDIFNVDLDTSAKVGDYDLFIRAYQEGKLVGESKSILKVVENLDVQEGLTIEKGLFSKIIIIAKDNDGNNAVDTSVRYKLSPFNHFLSSFNIEPNSDMKIDDMYALEWNFNLKPRQTQEVRIKIDYLPLILLFALVFIGGFLSLNWYMKGLRVYKSVTHIHDSEYKIKVHLINTSKDSLTKLQVIEVLPRLMHPNRDYGTLRPESVKHGIRGHKMIWEIHTLLPKEERIISYNVRSRMYMVGNLMLPATLVKYYKKSKRLKVKSNRLPVITGLIKE